MKLCHLVPRLVAGMLCPAEHQRGYSAQAVVFMSPKQNFIPRCAAWHRAWSGLQHIGLHASPCQLELQTFVHLTAAEYTVISNVQA